MQGAKALLLALLLVWVDLNSCSYLEYPRINFKGRFRADVATSNNDKRNFLSASQGDECMNTGGAGEFNAYGTNSWSFVDCVVTSVAYSVDNITTDPNFDPIIGKRLINNPNTAYAKIVDVDVDDQLLSSVIYGMTLGINWNQFDPQPDSFIGEFKPAGISSDSWSRQARSGAKYQQTLGTRATSRIENVMLNANYSQAMIDLKKLTQQNGNMLSIRFTLFNYSKNSFDNWFTYGEVLGSIGIARESESLQFPENRVMTFLQNPPIKNTDKDCQTIDSWMHGAYFDIDKSNSVLSIDLSNSFALGIQGNLCRLSRLYLGLLTNRLVFEPDEFLILDEVDYLDKDWYYNKAGIFEMKLDDFQMGLVKQYDKVVILTTEYNVTIGENYTSCNYPYDTLILWEADDSSCPADGCKDHPCMYVLLEETDCLVRPMDMFVNRMEQNNTVDIRLKVKHFGETPSHSRHIQLHDTSPNGPASKEPGKDISYHDKNNNDSVTAATDANGIATFEFIAGNVGEPREDMRLDGQVFTFGYCSHDCDAEDVVSILKKCIPTNEGNYLVFLVWSPYNKAQPYFWDTHVEPIFKQYENLYPAMSAVVKLGDYDDVTKPQNVRLINIAMTLPFEHVSYMPVTRDLSPTKVRMILEWFNTPNLPKSWEDIDRKLFEQQPYCDVTFKYSDKKLPNDDPTYSSQVVYSLAGSTIGQKFANISNLVSLIADPSASVLYSEDLDSMSKGNVPESNIDINNVDVKWRQCNNPDDLKNSLQTAIALEFSTIPPYMTALYSIKDGFNQEVYNTIRSVIMQEMLHMAQAANLLISIGGNPKIANPDKSFIPKCYPTPLPGRVLPNLSVTLAKASPQHIRDVFMMIEFPDRIIYDGYIHEGEVTANALTIGLLYTEIRECMQKLYNESSITFGHKDAQLRWPWKMYDRTSKLYQVTDIESANASIEMIVEQGEGTSQQDPTYLGSQELAHFYKFGELACKHRLNASADHHTYSFQGERIEFTTEGVWPMRDNPASKDIPPHTHTYHQAKVFHGMYRSLLNALQIVFDGKPDYLKEAMYIMEGMQIQAKKLMQMPLPAPDGHMQTCGPIFDYNWGDPACGSAQTIN